MVSKISIIYKKYNKDYQNSYRNPIKTSYKYNSNNSAIMQPE